MVDHINHDTYDNLLANLRLVSISENNKNVKTSNSRNGRTANTSRTNNGKWVCGFKYKNTVIHLMSRKDVNEAEIDSLIMQKYTGRMSDCDKFYILDTLPQERIEETMEFMLRRMKEVDENEGRSGSNCVEVAQLSLNGELIKVWESTRQINRELGYDRRSIRKCCQGTKEEYKGFKWMLYKDLKSLRKSGLIA